MAKSFWSSLPKSSGLGKLSKKHKKAVSSYEKRRDANARQFGAELRREKAQKEREQRKVKSAVERVHRETLAYQKKHNPAAYKLNTMSQKEAKAKMKKLKANSQWHFWGSRQTVESKNKVVASLKRQGYKVRVDGVGDYYKIYTMGRASYYS